MLLRFRDEGHRAILYREKWSSLALGVLGSFTLIGFSVAFYRLTVAQMPAAWPFVLLFCGGFGAFGLWMLLRLPAQARKVLRDGGVHHVVIDATGIRMNPTLGTWAKHIEWKDVAQVLLAERLDLVDHGRTHLLWGCMVIVFQPGAVARDGLVARLKAGISHSGEGLPFVPASTPRRYATAVETVLRRFAPDSVAVRRHTKLVFDRKRRRDRFEPA